MVHEAAPAEGADGHRGEQLALVRARVRAARPRPVDPPAVDRPVASVAVAVGLAHLDRPFDYLVPEPMSVGAVPGARVRVRFAGREVDGFVLDRRDRTEHAGRLDRIHRLVSPEPVLTPEIATLARAVADRYAGSLADVLRLAVPPRHAGAETASGGRGKPESAGQSKPGGEPSSGSAREPHLPAARAARASGGLDRYPGGRELLGALERAEPVRVVWSVLPGPDRAAAVADLVAATVRGGRGALVLAPDQRDLAQLDAAVRDRLGPDRAVVLTAGLGPAERYRRFLAVSRGEVRVVLGTRAAAFAPVRDLGLVLVWDDGDPGHAEQRAPYPHAREVAVLRASSSAPNRPPALVLAGHAVSAEGALLVSSGWARPLRAERSVLRRSAPRIVVPAAGPGGEDPLAVAARIPTPAWRVAREGLERGPVLVQVPRLGYVVRLACRTCRTPSSCPSCSGPMILPAAGPTGKAGELRCGWCARPDLDWRCPQCAGRGLRALRVGIERTAEELGRAFPRARVVQSTGSRPRARVPARPALVVATPGVEPVADEGYAAALLLDADVALLRPGLRTQEDVLRRWLTAAALVRSAPEGGVVAVAGDPGAPAVQHLVRWDPWGAGARELAEREPLALPPTARLATLSGPLPVVREAAAELGQLLDAAGAARAVTVGAVLELDVDPRKDPATNGPATNGPATNGPATNGPATNGPATNGPGTDGPGACSGAGGGGAGGGGEPQARVLVRARRGAGVALSAALSALQAGRSARRVGGGLRVQVDPVDLL